MLIAYEPPVLQTFCGNHELRETSRELVESFVATLDHEPATDRDALVCKLNSYGRPKGVQS